ncbi:hypothetical protein ABID21_003641 [Pseudorhizobium tarimense]|uniref:Uncharacterized protein n=1 Tax=Pseudorhizobium tarimense TaxID=1079109 RepID=A0ABV2HAE5_9HYPH
MSSHFIHAESEWGRYAAPLRLWAPALSIGFILYIVFLDLL